MLSLKLSHLWPASVRAQAWLESEWKADLKVVSLAALRSAVETQFLKLSQHGANTCSVGSSLSLAIHPALGHFCLSPEAPAHTGLACAFPRRLCMTQ